MKPFACWILAAAVCGPVFATPAPATLPAVSANSVQPVGQEEWTGRIREARSAVAEARRRHTAAVEAFQKARHRHRARGEAKQELMVERQDSRVALEEAERDLKGLLEEARRNGVPPGWIRDAEEHGPASLEP